jgi:NADH-quinone oxidoreductase subunit H
MISYEIIILLSILPLVAHSSSLSLTNIAQSGPGLLLSFPSAAFFLLALFAETNRAPFDLPEAEAELVAGYNLDYSSFAFAFFFLGEYANMITMSIIFIFLFLSGYSGGFFLFLIKVIFLLFTLV